MSTVSDLKVGNTRKNGRKEFVENVWMEKFKCLVQYKEKNGHSNVPADWNDSLYRWVNKQRYQYGLHENGKNNTLTEERIQKLNSVGFNWKVDTDKTNSSEDHPLEMSNDARWLSSVSKLARYKDRFGDCHVPRDWSEDTHLSNWVQTQRYLYRHHLRGKHTPLTAERIDKLNSLGFQWITTCENKKGKEDRKADIDSTWMRSFSKLQDFREKYGDCFVPYEWNEDLSLGRWVYYQRYEYRRLQKRRKSSLTQERIDKLNSIGFEWDKDGPTQPDTEKNQAALEAKWIEMFSALTEYKEKHGNCNVPKNWVDDNGLSNWVQVQRHQYRIAEKGNCGSLTKERINKLNSIGFQWFGDSFQSQAVIDARKAVLEKRWMEKFSKLVAYKEKYGDFDVPLEWSEDPSMPEWIRTQRRQYRLFQNGKKSYMTEERMKVLNSIGFDWKADSVIACDGALGHNWLKNFSRLAEYKDRFGDCHVPRGWIEDNSLGTWVYTLRKQYRRRQEGIMNELSDARIRMLNSINFEWYYKMRKPKSTNAITESNTNRRVSSRSRKNEILSYNEDDMMNEQINKVKEKEDVSNDIHKTTTRRLSSRSRKKEIHLTHEDDLIRPTKRRKKNQNETSTEQPLKKDSWLDFYNNLVKYKKKYGDCEVPPGWVKDPSLYDWITLQRSEYDKLQAGKGSHLTLAKIDKLESIGFEWNPPIDSIAFSSRSSSSTTMTITTKSLSYPQHEDDECVPYEEHGSNLDQLAKDVIDENERLKTSWIQSLLDENEQLKGEILQWKSNYHKILAQMNLIQADFDAYKKQKIP